MREDSIPVSTFTFKADVASSEGANNVVLAQIYNDLCPVQTPPQKADPRVRQTIDGHPIVIFWDNGSETKFIGKYNYNNDKGTEEVFGFAEGDESWEIRQNGTERTGFRSADFSGTDWQNDFEARYPDGNLDPTKLAALAEWLVSTNADAATNTALSTPITYDGVSYTTDTAEYRLAKFKAELADHANVDAMVYYYVITELFLCIDQREKNAFPTIFQDDPYWIMFFYDADSSIGIDNKGNLAFDYYLEDIDYTEAGDPVFNGQASVLWVNLRKCFYDKILNEYTRLRTTSRTDGSGEPLLSYNVVNNLYEAHQGMWSEAIYNEDGYRKSIEPYVLNGDTLYLPMLQGKKEQQRKWWLYNRFRYLDSKYNTGSSMETRITMRVHSKGNIKLMAYVNMYGHVYYNSEMVEHRMYRGQEYEFVWAATGAEDAVIGINDADMLTSLGDLSPLMVELIDISKATHLTSLKIGDGSEGYVNKNLNSITLGNNVLLRSLDLRNCTKLTQSVDASGCTSIEEIYLDGTAVSSVSVPNGGSLKVLHLPGTITNLTLRNQTTLTDFTIPSYLNITTLRLENNSSAVDPLAILSMIPENSRVRVLGVKMEVDNIDEIENLYNRLDTMRGLDENGNNVDKAQMSGTITIDTVTTAELARLNGRYLDITIKYNHLITKLTFCNYDGTVLATADIMDGGDGVYTGELPVRAETESAIYTFVGWSKSQNNVLDENALKAVTTDRTVYAVYGVTPIYYVRYYNYDGNTLLFTDKLIGNGKNSSYGGSTPTRPSTEQYNYTFIGWSLTVNGSEDSDALLSVTADRNVYAAYSATIRTYTIVWKNGSNILETDLEVAYGTTPTYDGETPVYEGDDVDDWKFVGWSPAISMVTGDATYTALFAYDKYYYSKIISREISGDYTNTVVTSIGDYAFYSCRSLKSVTLPAVASIGTGSFIGSANLTRVDLAALTNLSSRAFYNTGLTTLILRNSTIPVLENVTALESTPIKSGTGYIYVSKALVDSYKTASNWSAYADQIRAIEDYTDITGGVTA